MSTEQDDYDEYDLSEFSEADFAAIDVQIAKHSIKSISECGASGEPQIIIQMEQDTVISVRDVLSSKR